MSAPARMRDLLLSVFIAVLGWHAAIAQPSPVPTTSQPVPSLTTAASPALWDYRNLIKSEAFPASGANVGRGWNSFLRQQTAAICVDLEVANEARWIDSVKFRELFDREQLFQTLNVS